MSEDPPNHASAHPIDRSSRVFVAGHGGLVGSAIMRRLDR
ncbi:MAG: hypothetical protein ACJAR2_003806, partial [Ilumatobacter sp.]